MSSGGAIPRIARINASATLKLFALVASRVLE